MYMESTVVMETSVGVATAVGCIAVKEQACLILDTNIGVTTLLDSGLESSACSYREVKDKHEPLS